MKKILTLLPAYLWILISMHAQVGKVGINTSSPSAMLHVKDSSVLFSGLVQVPVTPGNPPATGEGVRMMWYPDKAAFRAGYVDGDQWNKDSIGHMSTALGENTTASGYRSFAAGHESKSTGYISTALGGYTLATNSYATALGAYTIASGNSSTAMGGSTIASGDGSTAAGVGTKAIGYYSTAIGGSTIASGHVATAMGQSTIASGAYSTTMGLVTKAKPYASVVLGQYNDTSSISSTSWNVLDPVFIIGNGISDNVRANAMTVLKNGNVGIGTINPLRKMHITAGASGGTLINNNASMVVESNQHTYIQFTQTNNREAGFLSGNTVTAIRSALLFGADSTIMLRTGGNTTRMIVKKDGRVGINTTSPTAMLHVKDSSVVFTGLSTLPVTPGNPPISGAGVRLMWYPDKAAFRVGYVDGVQWNKDSIGLYSIAMGQNAKAKGSCSAAIGLFTNAGGVASIAFGNSTRASGSASTALGAGTIASGIQSTAMGSYSIASGGYSIAMGSNSIASGDESTAIGQNSIASGWHALALGYSTTASSEKSTALGAFTKASGAYSTALGYVTEAEGAVSTSMGNNTKAFGSLSITMGNNTIARPYAALVLGRFNDTTSISSVFWNESDPVFIIGNGSADNARSNAITVLKNAKTGINIENPLAGLHIKGVEATFDAHIRLETATEGSTDYANIVYDGNMKYRTFSAGDEYQWRNSANNTTMTLQDDGDLFIDGILTPNSDRRLKTQVEPITDGLDKVLQLQGYHYLWSDPGRDSSLQTGVIAQDIEMILPELVKTDGDGMKGVNYIGIIPYLIEACKEQQIIISVQQAKLNSLEKEMQELKVLIHQMAASN